MTSIQIDRLDGLTSSVAYKGPVRVATTGNITLTGLKTVDGIVLKSGDRILVRLQNSERENGIYVVDTGPWRRSRDFNKARDAVKGTRVWVTEGDNGPAEYEVISENPINIGKSPILFELSSGSVNAAALALAARAAREWAQSESPISVASGGDGVTDHSSKWWAGQSSTSAAASADSANMALSYKTQAELAALAAGAPLFTTEPPLSSAPSPYLLQVAAGTQVWTHDGTTRTLVGWLGKIAFPLVRNLLEFDKTLGPVGTEIEAEGYRYKIAAATSADINVTTSGGVPLFIMPVDGSYYPWAAWGPVNDGVTNNYSKLRNAGDACRKNNISGLTFPSGQYFIGQEFVIDWQASIQGAGGLNYNNDLAVTTFMFPAGTNGFRVPRASTATSGKLGDWSRLKSFNVVCIGNNKNSNGHGIVLDARATLDDIWVTAFPEDGFHIEATAPDKNANNFIVQGCRATLNGRDGFFASGADANAGSFINCDSASNGRINFNDNSFLGNGFAFCHSDAPGRRAYAKGSDGQGYRCKLDHVATANTIPATGANWQDYWELASSTTSYPVVEIGTKYFDSRSGKVATSSIFHYFSGNANSTTTFVGCYSEGASLGSGTSSYLENERKTVVGGVGMNVDYPNSRGLKLGSPFTTTTYLNNSSPQSTDRIDTILGSRTAVDAISFQVRENNVAAIQWRLSYDSANKRWFFGSSGASSRAFYLMESNNSHGLPAGMLDFSPQGVAISSKVHVHMNAVPTSGSWRRGDRVYKNNPSPGDVEGWVCTTAGDAGTTAVFKSFGSIGA